MLKLNETPVRTARNYKINNIKLESFEVPNEIGDFRSVQILNDSSKIDIMEVNKNIDSFDLQYGLSKKLENQVKNQFNKKYKINIESKAKKTSQIKFCFNKENQKLVDNIEVVAKKDSKATIIIKYETSNTNNENNLEYYHNGCVRVLAEENAEIDVIIVNLLKSNAINLLSIENKLENSSKVKYTIIDFGGKYSITNYYSNLVGNNSNNLLNTIYLGNLNQVFDLNYIAELRGEKTNVDIEVQGALKDNAKKNFKGTIDFKKGCKKATGNENENCMLLSDKAKSIALPMLLCSEEDVEGNHSSSAGKIGEKELFYIMSRGFEMKEAMKLLVRANFNKILDNIKDEELKTEILNEIDRKID